MRGMTVSDYDPNHSNDMHAAIAAFVQKTITEHSGEWYSGGFSYRIDLHKADGTVKPFIYSTDKSHTELWRVT